MINWSCKCRLELHAAYCLIAAFGWEGGVMPYNFDIGWGQVL